MNTTDIALKEMYDAFAKCKTNKSRVEFFKTHKESGLYKSYDIKWDNLMMFHAKNKKRTSEQNNTIDNQDES